MTLVLVRITVGWGTGGEVSTLVTRDDRMLQVHSDGEDQKKQLNHVIHDTCTLLLGCEVTCTCIYHITGFMRLNFHIGGLTCNTKTVH